MDDTTMNSVREGILAKIERRWLTKTCRSSKCSVDMNNAPEPFDMINIDRLTTIELDNMIGQRKRCDYLYMCTQVDDVDVVIVPIELKGGTFQPGVVANQLQGGADVANAIAPPDVSFWFVPVLASHSPRRRHVWRQLRSPVVFRGESCAITAIQCGERLTTALEAARKRGARGSAKN